MNVFVTGGAGYIGSVTVERLLDSGHAVCVFDNLETGHREALDRRAAFIQGDLRDSAGLATALRGSAPDAVMHFAACALVGESMRRPERYFENNVSGGLNLLEAMRVCGTRRIVFSSTCAVYGEPKQVPISEATLPRPSNPYGESKLMFERMLDWYRIVHGFHPVCLRYFNAAGATERLGEDHDPETHLIPLILRVALGWQAEISVYGNDFDTPDGTCIRDYIHVCDLASAHLQALSAQTPGTVNLGTGRGASVREVIQCARDVTGRPIPVREAPRRPGDPARLIARAEKACGVLGWRPVRSDLPSIIADAWNWILAHPAGYAEEN